MANWIVAHIPETINLLDGCSAIGVAHDGVLVGGCLYTNYRPYGTGGTIEISCAGRGWLSRRIIGVMLGYPFYQLNCHRITALVKKRNKASRRLLEGVGFKLEGVHPEGYGPRTGDCLSYGMLKRWNRWPWKD